MTLPTKIKVGGFIYTVEPWDPREADTRKRFGECLSDRKILRIDLSYGTRQAAKTLLHEILHAICTEWSIDKPDDEESMVDPLSNGLHAVYRDNPEAMKWIGKILSSGDET